MKKLLLISAAIVISINTFSQSCLPDGIDFNTQAQVDNFQANYPGCTEIEGNVEIDGDDITNLDGLGVITSIGGYLYLTGNQELDDLSGLSSLTYVGGSFLVSNNQSLASLAGLENLVVVEEDVFISNNPVLTEISAIGNIDAGNVAELWMTGNIGLAACNIPFICNFLANPNGKIRIYSNAPGCSNVTEIADECSITLPCLPFGDYYFYTQAEIDNFKENYPGCTDLNGLVHIQGSDITSLAGLDVVNSISGALEIYQNPLLTNLAGLDSLASIGGVLSIVGNALLTDLSGLNNIDTGSISFLGINNNPLLAECDIMFVCDYLSGPFGYSHNNITGNADGCRNKDEVLMECTVGMDDMPVTGHGLCIAPNPSSAKITIENPVPDQQCSLVVFGLNGQEMVRQKVSGSNTVIDIGEFLPGIYFVRLEGEDATRTGKFVKLD